MNPIPDLRTRLRALDPATLVDLLCEQAERDPAFAERLRASAEPGDLAEVRTLLDGAGSAADIGATIVPVLDTLQRLLDAGTSADLAPLAKRTVDTLGDALGRAGAVDSLLRRAIQLYARACTAHPPPPGELAEWILRVEFDSPGWPPIRLADFAAALGEKGLAHIRSYVDKQPVATRLREDLAEISGDVDTLVRILAAKPPAREVSLRIVRVLRDAGRHTEAIAYAAKALGRGKPSVAPPELPRQREAPDNAEEIAEHRRQVEELIARGDAQHYRSAALELRKLRTLHRRAGTPEAFADYLGELLSTHRRKTRLITEIRNARIAFPRGRR
ncbi:hypothetical protein [Amycolatopsis suaedae]|uniref:Uncharacterized protein n=1 Tax=Amycolatopsis suaedae TaxID=2510978 RepID=A0A4Q7J6Y3_9PSEU|nr:hypothetical protein [Amycolatopsis suaedae]RZQ62093.1 hypothetical protein EWH70_21155 [Amycolatopsis suaedae]